MENMMQIPLHSMRRGLWFYFFSLGFRPFFLLAGAFASLSILLWGGIYVMGLMPLGIWNDAVIWHAHEMLFGYTAAVIAGFLLTAVPNWTKARPVKTWPLALLVGLWLAGRAAMFVSGTWPWIAGVADLLFLPAVAISLLPTVLRAQSYRNVVFFFIIALLSVCNAGIHLAGAGHPLPWVGSRTLLFVSVHLVGLMIVIFGGRVVPMFTRNALKLKGRDVNVTAPSLFNTTSILSAGLAIPAVAVSTHYPLAGGAVLFLAGAVNLMRMAFWQGTKTCRMPIVWVLHAGYFWLSLGYLLEGLALMADDSLYSLAMHTLTMGGIGTLTLGMMSRVSLGHTGRPLHVSGWVTAAYVTLQFGILIRVAGGWIAPNLYPQTVLIAVLAWCFAFGVFSVAYIPILLRPRADE